jgi:hypothetical protein
MSAYLNLQEARANRDLANGVLLAEIETIMAPLTRLDERTRASILVLVGLAELVTANPRLLAEGEGLGTEFAQSVRAVHGEGARLLGSLAERATAGTSPLDSPLDALVDLLRCMNLPAPVPYERRRTPRRLSDLPPCPCDP